MLSKIKTSQLLNIFIFLLIVLAAVSLRDRLNKSASSKDQGSFYKIAAEVSDYCVKNVALYKGKENCYAEEFKKLGEKNSYELSFKVLDSLQQIDKSAIGCHLIAHGIGWGSYKRDPSIWKDMVQNMPTRCSYGSIHGVIESYVLSLPEKSLSKAVIPTICGETPRADCNHIIGHLLLVQTDASIPKALDLCEVFKEVAQNRFCISGVFMEYQTALNLVSHDLAPASWLNWPARMEELETLCRAQVGKFAEGCWEEIVHVALVKFDHDPKKVFDLCSSAQVPNGAKRCKMHSLGIIGASRNFELARLKSVCAIPQKDDPNFERDCYPAMVSSTLSTIPTKVAESVAFCNSLEDKFKTACFSMLGVMSPSSPVIKNQLPKACKQAPVDLQNYCLGVSSMSGQNSIIQNPND